MEEKESWGLVKDRRREKRHLDDRPDFVSVEFRIMGKGKNSYAMGIESPEVIENCSIASQQENNNS